VLLQRFDIAQRTNLPSTSYISPGCRALLGEQYVVSGNPMSVLLTENMLHFKGKLVVPTRIRLPFHLMLRMGPHRIADFTLQVRLCQKVPSTHALPYSVFTAWQA
jgi:hypothetical protein